jgi:hypothetical protein
MAQIAANYPNMDEYFGGKAAGLINALEQRDQAMRSTNINQQQALQDLFQSGEKHPLDMQALKDVSNTRQAQLPGIVADSSQREMDTRDNTALGDVFRQDVKRGEGRVKIVKGKEQEMAHQAALDYSSNDPVTKAKGKRVLEALNAAEELKQEDLQKRQIALENQRHKNAMERDEKYGRFAARVDPAKAAEIKQQTNPLYWQLKARNEPDPERRKFYSDTARDLQAMTVEQRDAVARVRMATEVDVPAVVNLPRVAAPPVATVTPPAPPPGIGSPAVPKQMSPQDAQAKAWALANPNDPRAAKIIEKLKANGL